jgi:hypothetical protein
MAKSQTKHLIVCRSISLGAGRDPKGVSHGNDKTDVIIVGVGAAGGILARARHVSPRPRMGLI